MDDVAKSVDDIAKKSDDIAKKSDDVAKKADSQTEIEAVAEYSGMKDDIKNAKLKAN